MAYTSLSKKVIEKWRKEDIELHKRVIVTYLIQSGLGVTTRNKFFKLYDTIISPENILCYFNKPVHIFVNALVLNKLERICDILPNINSTFKKKRRKKL